VEEVKEVKVVALKTFAHYSKTYRKGTVFNLDAGLAERLRDNRLVRILIEDATSVHDKVSIVILVKDALKYVQNCIRSVNRYTNNFELIIVDNGSNAETKKWLSDLDWLDFTLIENEKNMGVAYGWNQGIKVAKYDYICFLNSDTLVSPGWLPRLMEGFKRYPEAGIVGPSTSKSSTVQSPQTLKDFRKAGQKDVDQISATLKKTYEVTPVVGFCFVVRKEVFETIGVFDYRRYGLATHEDIDFVWRAGLKGFKSVWCRGSYVHHYGNRTTHEMGLNPREIRLKNKPVWEQRKRDKNLYVENDVELGKVKRIKGRVPILMITWNRLDYTKKAIKAIRENTKDYKLFIFDNHSTDGTRECLRELEDVEIYYSDKNTGLVPPMNYFLRKYPDHRYVAKVDNDTVVSKGWLRKLKEVMEEIPLFAVEADHYLMLSYDIKENMDYYRHLYKVDFKGESLYLSDIVGGTGTIIRRSMVEKIPDVSGTLSGWILYQKKNDFVSAFYTGAWVDRLDQEGTNRYKKVSDYPDYDRIINQMRPRKKIGSKRITSKTFANVRERMEKWYESLQLR